MAMGRMGQVVAPLTIGALLAKGLTVNRILLCCRVPALCAACAVALLRWSGPRAEERPPSMSAAPP
jgi:hypothetical protein